LAKAILKIKPAYKSGEIKRFVDSRKTAVIIPVIVEPIKVGIALCIVPIEIKHVTIAIQVLPDRAIVQNII
jgi:hypothetical protein